MKLPFLRTCLEGLSFVFWIGFTILSISLAGLGLEGMIVAGFMLMVSSPQPVHFPLGMVTLGGLGVLLSIFWRQVGIDHFHYLLYDSPAALEQKDEAPSHVLQDLIRDVETSEGLARTESRSRAKAWLIGHVSSLDEDDLLLARTHFGYLLPAGWGL